MKRTHRMRATRFGLALPLFGLIATLVTGCGGGGGTLSVLLEPEGTITDGLDPGDDVEDIRDGWRVRYDKYIVVIGDVDVHLSTDEETEDHDEALYAVDLTQIPGSGLELWQIPGLPKGRYEFFYSLGGGAHGAERHESVSEDDFDTIVDEDATYLIEGTISKEDGVSCPPEDLASTDSATEAGESDAGVPCFENTSITFSLLVPAETLFGPCQLDGVPGFAITSSETTTVAATLHGDHLFFNGFPTGDEGGIVRLAQWLADSDLDLNGEVTQTELETIAPSDLSEMADYQFSGAPIDPIDTLWDYVSAQLKTQGHMNGEGECAVDGEEHDHSHEEEE